MRGRAPERELKKSQREGESGGKEIRDPIETNSNSRSLLLIAKQHTKHLPGTKLKTKKFKNFQLKNWVKRASEDNQKRLKNPNPNQKH